MSEKTLTRRQVLALAGGTGVGGLGVAGYVTDNPLHRTTIERFETRHLETTPLEDTFWLTETRLDSALPAAAATHLTGVRYRGVDEETDERHFDVFGVVFGQQSSLLGEGALVGPRVLAVRGVGSSGTISWDSGDVPYVRGGPLKSPAAVADALSLTSATLNDEAVLRQRIEADRFPGTDTTRETTRLWTDFELSQSLLARSTYEHDRLTQAGLLYGLHGISEDVVDATPEYEGRGEQYSWIPGTVTGHVVRYTRLAVVPDDGRCRLKVAQAIPRPSILGQPQIETGLLLNFPT